MKDQKFASPYIITADIGGSHITAAICNINTFTIEQESISRIEVKSQGSAAEIFASWHSALQLTRSSSPANVTRLAVAIPGPFDYQNGISLITGLNKYEAIYGEDIKAALAAFLKIERKDILFRNDAEATIAGEALAGAGSGNETVLGLTLGTGFGSAYYADGTTTDLNFGSNLYLDTIADEYFSTRWFQKRYFELSGNKILNVKILAARLPQDDIARQVFNELAENLANFLQKPLQEIAPGILVLCGNITKAAAYFLPQLRTALPNIAIETSILGEKAALIGAAELFTHIKAVQS